VKTGLFLSKGIAIEMVLAITPLALPVLSVWSPSVSFAPPSLMVSLRQVAPVVNPVDMGFILLMVLSAYYLIRRKRQFIR
jgi:hypothetical protein